MSLVRVDQTRETGTVDEEVLGMSEREIITLYPQIHHITDTVSGETVWTRTMAYYEGTYDPGTKVLKG